MAKDPAALDAVRVSTTRGWTRPVGLVTSHRFIDARQLVLVVDRSFRRQQSIDTRSTREWRARTVWLEQFGIRRSLELEMEEGVDSDRVWEGPIHGNLGILADDGERAQCHICGEFYGNLGGHVSQVHGVAPEDYKAFFGLNATTGLLGPALKQIRQQQADARKASPAYARFMAAGAAARAALPPEQRSNRGRRLRLQQRLDPKVQAARRASLDRANEVLRERKAAGLHRPAGWGDRDPREVSALGHEKLAELRQDPAWRADFARKVSEARGGRLKVTCVICGRVFAEPQSHKGRKTCSSECFTALRRRLVADRRDRLATDRTERQHRGVELGERRRHIGYSIEEVARRSGLSAAHVSRIERGLNVPSTQALDRIERALRDSGPPLAVPELLVV